MREQSREPSRWGLRARLMIPVVILGLISIVGMDILNQSLVRRTEDLLATQRGTTVLHGLTHAVEQHRDKAQRGALAVAQEPELISLVARSDSGGLVHRLQHHLQMMDLDGAGIMTDTGVLLVDMGLVHLTTPEMRRNMETAALTLQTTSEVVARRHGFVIAGAAPVLAEDRVIATLIVVDRLTDSDLLRMNHGESIWLALFQEDRLEALLGPRPLQPSLGDDLRLYGRESVEVMAAQWGLEAVAQPLDQYGLLMALVPTGELAGIAWQQRLITFAAALTGVLCLLLLGHFVIRDAVSSVEATVRAARAVGAGGAGVKVPPSDTREMNELGEVVNQLSQQVHAQMSELTRRALTDDLTDLPNRRHFCGLVGRSMLRAKEKGNRTAVLFVDLDDFKLFNDSMGHAVGDRVLREVANRISHCVGADVPVARLGSDEFAVMIESPQGPLAAEEVADRIQAALTEPFLVGTQGLYLTSSIGIACCGPCLDDPESLLRATEVAMYHAKAQGKARRASYDGSMAGRARERLRLSSDLHRALERGEFSLHYQPVVELGSGRISQVEALLRWHHPERGAVSPAEFIPLTEETGLILPIGHWVLSEACRQVAIWQSRLPAAAELGLSVNLSARQLQHPRLVLEIAQALAESGLHPRHLTLEITESTMVRDAEAASTVLRELQATGIRIAIDDFGTAYSSLAYLKRLPVNVLKIDRTFVEPLGGSGEDTAIVNAIVALARARGLRVTAEGVETLQQLEALLALGVESGQGYLFARALPPAVVPALLAASGPLRSAEPELDAAAGTD